MNWVKKGLAYLVNNPLGWFLTSPWAKVGHFMYTIHLQKKINQKVIENKERERQMIVDIFPDKRVQFGPFKGLRYPEHEAKGSALLPKLLGTYEAELHSTLEEIVSKRFDEIINIGCGEGYYAIGLALRIPQTKVLAFDIDEEAQALTRKMATINNCEDRIDVRGICTIDFLKNFKPSGKLLIISDCEGFEKDLFPGAYQNLTTADLLIEVHDFIDITISSSLREIFDPTHDIKSYMSIDDLQKPRLYHREPVAKLSLQQRYEVMREGRPALMEWLYLTPKVNV